MSTQYRLALVLPEQDPATRRYSTVYLPSLLFVAFVHGAESIADQSLDLLGDAVSARYEQANNQGDKQRAALFRWIWENALWTREAISVTLDPNTNDTCLRREQSDRILALVDDRASREAANPVFGTTRGARHLMECPMHFTTKSTDPIVHLLECVRLAHGVGSRPQHTDVCNDCAGLDATLGDIDPVCPLCSAVRRRSYAMGFNNPNLVRRASEAHSAILRALLQACEPGATMDSIELPF